MAVFKATGHLDTSCPAVILCVVSCVSLWLDRRATLQYTEVEAASSKRISMVSVGCVLFRVASKLPVSPPSQPKQIHKSESQSAIGRQGCKVGYTTRIRDTG
eukprot:1705828-Amphidinium_carterae.1